LPNKHFRAPEFFIGVDLGKLRDYTAIAVLEKYFVSAGYDAVYHREVVEPRTVLRMLQQIRLGTSYPAVVESISQLIAKLSIKGRCTAIIDATGVGQPVVDALRAQDLDCDLIPVVITGGEQVTRVPGGLAVPKSELLVSLQMTVANAELRIPSQLPLRKTLVDELTKIGRNLRAVGSGHDDLVMALALACWKAGDNKVIGEQNRRLL
jgi:hypothetical protein